MTNEGPPSDPDIKLSPAYGHHGVTSSAGKGKGKARADDEEPPNTNPPNIPELEGEPHPIGPVYGRPTGGVATQEGEVASSALFCPVFTLTII